MPVIRCTNVFSKGGYPHKRKEIRNNHGSYTPYTFANLCSDFDDRSNAVLLFYLFYALVLIFELLAFLEIAARPGPFTVFSLCISTYL